MPDFALKLIYHSLIGSKLRYGVTAWGSARSTALKKLNMLNDRAVANLTQSSETLQLTYQRLKIFQISSLHKLETIKFIKLLNEGKLPAEFNSFAEPVSHHHLTRISSGLNYQLPHVRTDLGKSSIKFQGIQIWNDMPGEIKHLSGNIFKNHLKTYVLDLQTNTN